MAGSDSAYRHKPLSSARSIRVLWLHPSAQRQDCLRCSIAEVSLDDRPKYWALSYSWDAQAPTHPIRSSGGEDDSVEQCVLKITANCAEALKQLRHPTERRTMWIDSICIDQTSVDERSSQVALMGEIYQYAERVIVWLGEKDAATEQAMRLLNDISDLDSVEQQMGFSRDAEDVDEVRARLHQRTRELLADATSAETDKIGPLFRRSWFSRMWTIQEMTFPPTNRVVVQCGDATIAWYRLIVSVDILRTIRYPWGGYEQAMKLQGYLVDMMMIHRFPEAREIATRTRPAKALKDLMLANVLIRGRNKAATDPKDKVYALYGVLDQLKVDLPLPDYRKPLEDVYAEITAACIRFDKDLFVLFFVPSDARRSGLPSWVPDWSDAGWLETDPRFPVPRGRFAAAGGAEPRWSFPPNPRQLLIYGKVLDTVIYRTRSLPLIDRSIFYASIGEGASSLEVSDGMRTFHRAYETLREWVDVAGWSGESYPTGERVEDALRALLVSDTSLHDADLDDVPPYDPAWLKIMRASNDDITRMAFWSQSSGNIPVGRLRAAEQRLPVELRTAIALSRNLRVFVFHCVATCLSAKKCFFRTADGYFGTAPDMIPDPVQPGDVVAIVAGMAMPVLLRPAEGGGFRLISHCFLRGIMYGEAWERFEGDGDEILLV
ncbi:hypothetical protein VTI74DRAFT_5309 [Chaetomium olivicolor]